MKTLEQLDPVFIIGNPRSGTSLLRLILTTHPQILIPPECGFIIWLRQQYGTWEESDNQNSLKIEAFLDDLFACKKFSTWFLEREAIREQIIYGKPSTYSKLCSIIYFVYGLSINKSFSVWGDKNNFHLNYLSELMSLYPKARVLHIVRDGRDIACSYREVMEKKYKSPYAPKLETDISKIAEEWSSNVIKVDEFMHTLSDGKGKTIKYEDLVSIPQSTIKDVCEWLGVQFESVMLEYYQQNKQKKLEPELTIGWKKRTLQPISSNTVRRYSRMLSEKEIKVFETVASVALHRFLYAKQLT